MSEVGRGRKLSNFKYTWHRWEMFY